MILDKTRSLSEASKNFEPHRSRIQGFLMAGSTIACQIRKYARIALISFSRKAVDFSCEGKAKKLFFAKLGW
jgi:hypothetical protein